MSDKTVLERTLAGSVNTWDYNGNSRLFSMVMLPFSEARQLFKVAVYNAVSGRGEQRSIVESHVRKLGRAVEDGSYTPAPFSVSLRKKHKEALTVNEKNNTFSLKITSDEPLSLTDGQHRMDSLSRKLADLQTKLKSEKDEAKLQILRTRISEIESLPIHATLYLNGDIQTDFLNLQEGRQVDSSTIFSMSVQRGLLDNPAFKVAFETCKLLNSQEGSPFKNSVKLDSRGVAPLPISTLCAKGASDQGTSLVGLAEVGLSFTPALKQADLANLVCNVFGKLQKESASVLDSGKPLAFIGAGGTKGSATMMNGVALCTLYQMKVRNVGVDDETVLSEMATSAKNTLDGLVTGGFSGPNKRAMLGTFAKEFFQANTEPKHEGVPIELIKLISSSAFGVSPLPKATPVVVTALKAPDGTIVTGEDTPADSLPAA